jgi:transposase InsO family protein
MSLPLPVTELENKYIIVAIDYFMKWVETKVVKVDNAEEVAIFIYEDIICRYGCPQRILSDRGSHFNNKMIEELMKNFEIRHGFLTSYHSKTNGLIERFNKTLCESLAKLKGNKDWNRKIAPVLFAYRNKRQESTKIKLFYLTYRREA